MIEEKRKNNNDVRNAISRATRKASLLTEDAIDFYEQMAKDPAQPAKFRKECWDAIVERGPGKAAAQAPKKIEAQRRRMVVGPISKDSIARTQQDDERKALFNREPDLEGEEPDEGDDQADMG